MNRCAKCNREYTDEFFAEDYDPENNILTTYFLCKECKIGLTKTIKNYIGGKL